MQYTQGAANLMDLLGQAIFQKATHRLQQQPHRHRQPLQRQPLSLLTLMFRFSAFSLMLSLAFPGWANAMTYESYGLAVLQGLDKVTGRVEKFELPEGGNTRFGTLYVTARACRKTPPEELPEAVAFVEIDEVKPGDTAQQSNKRWYSGWMFASNPSLAALEHPVYDVAVVDCKQQKLLSLRRRLQAPRQMRKPALYCRPPCHPLRLQTDILF